MEVISCSASAPEGLFCLPMRSGCYLKSSASSCEVVKSGLCPAGHTVKYRGRHGSLDLCAQFTLTGSVTRATTLNRISFSFRTDELKESPVSFFFLERHFLFLCR